MAPKLTVSGFRGIWGDTLTLDIAKEYSTAFISFLLEQNNNQSNKILIARDGRESGKIICEEIKQLMINTGLNVVDLDIMPTPSVLFLVKSERALGAIIVTASHNPIEYNGLKFVTSSGFFTSENDVRKIESLRGKTASAVLPRSTEPLPAITNGSNLFEKHLTSITNQINPDPIKAQNFKVALDPINAVGCLTTPKLLEHLNVKYFLINGEPTGKFAHEPEPLPKNLSGLQSLVKEKKCDIGFAQDPDGDRLVICDENGFIPSEEMTLALCVKSILSKNKGDIVINLSTSNMCVDISKEFGRTTYRSKVGEANVIESMKEHNAIAGGEGGGGIIYPKMNFARDSFSGIALILELMTLEQKPLSEIIAGLPKYFMKKEKISFKGNLQDLYKKIKNGFSESKEDSRDGLRLDFANNSWIHVRPSNTEPVVRIIAEAKDQTELEKIIKTCQNLIQNQ